VPNWKNPVVSQEPVYLCLGFTNLCQKCGGISLYFLVIYAI